jgi:hypothetical protein
MHSLTRTPTNLDSPRTPLAPNGNRQNLIRSTYRTRYVAKCMLAMLDVVAS